MGKLEESLSLLEELYLKAELEQQIHQYEIAAVISLLQELKESNE